MTKLHRCLGLALVAAFFVGLAGCSLYFGNDKDDDWSYCAADGYYVNGERVSATCPDGAGPGNACEGDSQCAAGCYCNNGKCDEAGFCSDTKDCPPGYVCDERQSCVPNKNPACEKDQDCLAGSVCQDGHCDPTCVCENDADAQAKGYAYCDELRGTCHNANPSGSCLGVVTCTTGRPSCPVGSVPLIDPATGCWADIDLNGQPECSEIGACDQVPVCESRQHAEDCPSPCTIVTKGLNCTFPGGGACQGGQPGCVCQQYVFDSCRT